MMNILHKTLSSVGAEDHLAGVNNLFSPWCHIKHKMVLKMWFVL